MADSVGGTPLEAAAHALAVQRICTHVSGTYHTCNDCLRTQARAALAAAIDRLPEWLDDLVEPSGAELPSIHRSALRRALGLEP